MVRDKARFVILHQTYDDIISSERNQTSYVFVFGEKTISNYIDLKVQ